MFLRELVVLVINVTLMPSTGGSVNTGYISSTFPPCRTPLSYHAPSLC